MKTNTASLLLLLTLLTGCASIASDDNNTTSAEKIDYTRVTNPLFARIGIVSDKAEKDRLAILGMQGEYRVDFNFEETVLLKPGYSKQDDKNTGGFETVVVVKEDPNHIVLQHLLVTGTGYVVKHWRQDWFFEATERFEFVEDQTWERMSLPDEKIAGHWTQSVYEVSAAPSYCGTGVWNHRYGVSTWTSDRTWRPLPRREYTKRSDYNTINAENRHTVTSHGWTHEQDNTKTRRDGRDTAETLVREFGFNDYRSIEGFDFEPAYDYWRKTEDYWARVRSAWDRRIDSGQRLKLKTTVDGMPIIVATFEHAENVESMSEVEQLDAIETVLDEWTVSEQLVSER